MAIVIYNKIIPCGGYKAMAVMPFVFAKEGAKELDIFHEKIHLVQQFEVFVASLVVLTALILCLDLSWWWLTLSLVVYYALYGLMYLIRLLKHGNHKEAYRNNPFEQEAYCNQSDFDYLKKRKLFAWVGYFGKTTYFKK